MLKGGTTLRRLYADETAMTLKLTEHTILADMGLVHLDVILEEAFGVRPRALFPKTIPPATVGDLARVARRSVADVIKRLTEIMHLNADIEIDCASLSGLLKAARPPVLLDVRERWEYDLCRIPGSILLADADFPELLEKLKAEPQVVTICHHGVRSYSAALFLKEKGIRGVRSLAGGVEAWATTIDRGMARY